MTQIPREYDPLAPALAIDVGNTNTSIATWHEGRVKSPVTIATGDDEAFAEAFAAHREAFPKKRPVAVIIGAVVPAACARIAEVVQVELGQRALIVGDTIPLPIDVAVEDPRAIGVDRVCAAAAAACELNTACTIVDFGTAVTVDLVDDEGVLQGGAILPGLELQLRSLNEHTAALPKVMPAIPELPYGRNTAEAMQTGVCRGVAGAVRGLVEAYATKLGSWPHVVATGGSLELLAPQCDFIDSAVANLTLQGVGLAYARYLSDRGV